MDQPFAYYTIALVVLTAFATWQGFRREDVLDRLIFDPRQILWYGDYHRLITSGFIHGDWLHFMFNMFSLYVFGETIEIFFGPGPFLLIYLAGIVGGNILSLWLHRNHEYRALGASGGVCGIIYAYIFLFPGGEIEMFFIPIGIPAWIYAILFLVVSFIGMRRRLGNIGHDAHIGGALVGLLTATAMYPSIIERSPWLYAGIWIITAAMFLYEYKRPSEALAVVSFRPSSVRAAEHGRSTRHRRDTADADQQKLDRLLDKISAKGIDSLNWFERRRLHALSKKR